MKSIIAALAGVSASMVNSFSHFTLSRISASL
ncbi:hypothetical protein KPNJ1_05056 [Klebsiella pneumoniae 30660/NJST258_1]|uniref:Uncharacterized protein n=1 Tax=Klebsiella pneumoniae 30684/NJST258_2 TaxID=1420013 RepID=W8UPI8_KLEPN|nr:hypothetical protein KPNJ2_05002 [Klebsiella pneumoniae 30684/NJST258_2]AHM87456.1 hypothetical protein KPNJ1_05056 [Klebsiella pneumoniae 30660/NJST258_1]